jgi:hypothetical protein
MGFNIGDILQQWADYGVFTYVFPFLIIFAIVFAILQKTKLFGDGNNVKGINAIISIAVGFLALVNNHVSSFFETIMPRFGIALAIFFVILVLLGFMNKHEQAGWVGWVLAIGVLIWAWTEWDDVFGSGFMFTQFINDYFWGIIALVGIGGLIFWVIKGEESKK